MFYIHSLSQAQDKWKLFLAIAILNFLGFCVNISYRQKTCQRYNLDLANTFYILHEKCPYSELLSEFSLNVGKYGPEKLRLLTIFTQ